MNSGFRLLYIDYARASKYAPLILLELCAGLRHEEACAVTKEDIEICGAAAYINIDKARVTVGGRVVEKDTKKQAAVYGQRLVVYPEVALLCTFNDYTYIPWSFLSKSIKNPTK